MLGRAYTAAEDLGSNDAVIVLSHEFWQRRLGGRADVLRMTLTTGGRPRTVIGVMPAGFTVAGQKADFLIPLRSDTGTTSRGERPRQLVWRRAPA